MVRTFPSLHCCVDCCVIQTYRTVRGACSFSSAASSAAVPSRRSPRSPSVSRELVHPTARLHCPRRLLHPRSQTRCRRPRLASRMLPLPHTAPLLPAANYNASTSSRRVFFAGSDNDHGNGEVGCMNDQSHRACAPFMPPGILVLTRGPRFEKVQRRFEFVSLGRLHCEQSGSEHTAIHTHACIGAST